jgi:hypothetical protein
MARFAINVPDIATAAERVGGAAGLSFERRESDHWGPYCLIRLPGAGSIRVLENVDPVYRADLDPPEDQFFESGFPADWVLVDIDSSDAAQVARWSRVVRDIFPDAVSTGRAAAE